MEDNTQVVQYNVDEIMNYQDIINHIRARITLDENGFTDEVREVMAEAKQEIVSLRKSISDLQQENMKIFEDNCIMARQLYVNERLMEVKSETKKEKIKRLFFSGNTDFKSLKQEQIDNVFIIFGLGKYKERKKNNG